MFSNSETTIDAFRVYVRIRPLNEKEKIDKLQAAVTKVVNKGVNKSNNILLVEDLCFYKFLTRKRSYVKEVANY